ncbi:alpha/beta hydrolase [Paenarthrobacter nicotinovorans]|nr:alpha/beta hydrolase [Paenarthrobacter nicotinovorans]
MPVLLFAVAETKQNPELLELHWRQAASIDGTVVLLPREHYLQHTYAN